jgi:hypothetical protein
VSPEAAKTTLPDQLLDVASARFSRTARRASGVVDGPTIGPCTLPGWRTNTGSMRVDRRDTRRRHWAYSFGSLCWSGFGG